MQKVRDFVAARPVTALLIALAVGGVLALAFPAVRKLLKPVASKVPGAKTSA
ncbi:hypothetical protein [Oleiharenicola sp. Vm1]|uniref:hypothetical protein n=1 Tax=Oleiharenicola sp. Vm1 TaxID=3398393 RepID=UPI0039F640BD